MKWQHGASPYRQVGTYLDGTRTTFDLSLVPTGTELQRNVWAQLLKISYGGLH